jgi:hypothetical protein
MLRPLFRQSASSSRSSLTVIETPQVYFRTVATLSRHDKGKQRQSFLTVSDRIPGSIRHFHSSSPRYAVPLIPATAAILKVSLKAGPADRSPPRY